MCWEEKESESQAPELSPGVVKNDEFLLRTMFHPEHIVDGRVIPPAIPSKDLKERGYSLDREKYAVVRKICRRMLAQQRKQPDNRQEPFISKFLCERVRNLVCEEDKRAFIVVDDAVEENTAHASILSAYPRKPAQIKRLKSTLLPVLQEMLIEARKYSPEE